MHYTIRRDNHPTATTASGRTIGTVQHQYVPGHSLGDGWTRHIVELGEGDTADNPLSTKGPIYGPAFVVYDCHKTGITVHLHESAEEFYKAIWRVPFPDAEQDPMRLDGKTVAQAADYLTGLTEDGCTGHIESTPNGVYVHHDGQTCPVHEGTTEE
jgi:hypothetical protein